MGMNKKYWTGMEELDNTSSFQESAASEFPQGKNVEEFLGSDKLQETNTGRRDFLKFMGFSVAAATLAACETPVVKSIPYVVKPEEITPGVPNYYASTFYDGNVYSGIMVKTREGRPIHIKGNKKHGFKGGNVSAVVNASVLSVYDSARLQGPTKNGVNTDWGTLDSEVSSALNSAGSIRILSNTIISPSTQRAINEFSAKYNGKVQHIQWDAYSYQGIRLAHEQVIGKSVIPAYDFSKAKTIVSVGADFLGTWLSSTLYQADYASSRKPHGEWMSKHYQFESIMSLTGSNADVRVAIKPSQEGAVVASLYSAVVNGSATAVDGVDTARIEKIATELKANAGASLVVCGNNNTDVQALVCALNKALNNYGTTANVDQPLNLFQGNDAAMDALVTEMNNGGVGALIVYGTNPAYAYGEAFKSAMAKVPCVVSFNAYADETGAKANYCAPDHHYLESWNDLSPVAGRVDFVQPTIVPLYNTRAAQESILRWTGNGSSYYNYIQASHTELGTDLFNMSVHNGTSTDVKLPVAENAAMAAVADTTAAVSTMANLFSLPKDSNMPKTVFIEEPAVVVPLVTTSFDAAKAIAGATSNATGEWEVVMYQKITMGTGEYANNPVLHETPDPITKITWDNYVAMAPSDMKKLGLNTYIAQDDPASLVKVTVNGKSLELPACPMPGQKAGTIGIALGYGRGEGNENIGKSAFQVDSTGEYVLGENGKPQAIGKNAFGFVSTAGTRRFNAVASLEATGNTYPLASTQLHSTVMGRESVVKETVLAKYLAEKDKKKGEASWNPFVGLIVHEDVNKDGKINAQDKKPLRDPNGNESENLDLWRDHPVEGVGHRWGMTIDLSSCIGCGSCITACHTENNVPVVGKDEVRRHRDMHWMRIDRYFSSDYASLEETKKAKELGTISAYSDMEIPAENPQTVHMPMMCQHCNHAPCETVCPVAATTHSNEGLNNMAYNRCIGTRYCANNCPYKVRRFNWFNYVGNEKFSKFNPSQDETMRMVLNPDVTVRTRGVMEKCSMCQQRIQAGKLAAKIDGTPVLDGSVQSACSEACPTNAIVFGDLNDTKSLNAQRAKDNRSYHALEEVGIQPNIFYMTKVRNIEETEA
jgi:molybdopterin-containing oxidoreductase family iron-sulfur binding subunit